MKKIVRDLSLDGPGLTSKLLSIALCLILFAGLPVMAQVRSRIITGVVKDQAGASLSGATINVRGTAVATTSDSAGNFRISVPAKTKTLVISYVGMDEKEVNIADQSTVDVSLNFSRSALNDVVVVGYGRQRKESVVGAIVQTTGATLQRAGGVSSIGAALTGNVPGVITVQGTGMPGNEDPTIYIRGQGSLNYQAPLVLVDGIERQMSGVDIGSIESISILKDASATAVFGVKGANGVILITTKRGVEGKANINAIVNYTLKFPSRLPAKYDAYDALKIRNLAIERELNVPNTNSWQDYTPLPIIDKYRHPANAQEAQQYPNIDWQKESLKKLATAQNANISVSGGSGFVKYFTSVDLLHEGDIMKIPDNGKGYKPGFFYDRLNIRANLDFKLTSSTTLSANLSGLSGNQQGTYSGFEYSWYQGIYGNAPDLFYPQYSDGTYGYYPNDPVSTNNPALILGNNGVRNTKTTQINTDFVLNQDLGMLVKNLSLRGTYSLDNRFVSVGGITDNGSNITKWINPNTGAVSYGNTAGTNQFDYVVPLWGTAPDAFQTGQTYRKKFYQLQLNYSAKVGMHNITAMGLFMRNENATGSNFARYREDWVGRVTYNWANKYFAEFNGAYNGSDQFGPNYRFGFFPSAALGWTLTNEQFMKSISWITSLKLRGSYGKVGSDNVIAPAYYYIPQQYAYNSASGTGGGGQLHTGENSSNSPYVWYRESSIGNPNVHWETVAKTNIGLDYSFLRGLITGSFDVYQDDRYDILIAGNQRAVPVYFGGPAPASNLGKTRVRGYELEVKLNKSVSKNLRLWANLAMTHSKDKILVADNPQLLDPYLKTEGFQIGQTRSQINTGFYNTWDQLYGSTIVDQNDNNKLPGNFNLLDYNGDGVINSFDNVPYGYPSRPQNTYTASLGFDYKRFSFFVQLYAVNNVTRELTQGNFAAKLNSVYKQGDYWSPDNTDARGPVPRWKSQGYSYGNFYLYDGSYVRLKSAEVSYTLNPVWLKHVGIQSMRVFANGNNLLFWSKMPDDREANVGSNNYSGQGAYPTVRRVNFGFNLSL